MAIFPGEPGLSSCPLDFRSPVIPRLCISWYWTAPPNYSCLPWHSTCQVSLGSILPLLPSNCQVYDLHNDESSLLQFGRVPQCSFWHTQVGCPHATTSCTGPILLDCHLNFGVHGSHGHLPVVTHAPFHASILRPALQTGPMHEFAGVGQVS